MGKGAEQKGYLKNLRDNSLMKFLYNPYFSDSQKINYTVISSPCSSYPKVQYTGTSERTISLNLFLHDTGEKMRSHLQWFERIRPNSTFAPAPRLVFAFGKYCITCVVTDYQRQFTGFDKNLLCTDATISLSLMEVRA